MTSRSAFGGGDQTCLCDVQCRDGRKHDARTHLTSATSAVTLAEFESGLIEWRPEATVLECGCGTGRFWLGGDVSRSARIVVTDRSSGMVDEALKSARSTRRWRRSSATTERLVRGVRHRHRRAAAP